MIGAIKYQTERIVKKRVMRGSGYFWFRTEHMKIAIEWPTGLSKSIYYKGVYHAETTKYIIDNVGSNDVCVDVGANVGYITILLAKNARRVIAFEPDPLLRRILRLNLKENDIHNVEVRSEAISDEIGRARFFLNKEPMFSGLVGHDGFRDMIEVDTVTLDSVISKPDIVKIDVEGAESRVLKGMKDILQKEYDLRLILEVEPSRKGFSESLYDYIDGWKFRNMDGLNVLCWRDLND